jgi:hypothetical protein
MYYSYICHAKACKMGAFFGVCDPGWDVQSHEPKHAEFKALNASKRPSTPKGTQEQIFLWAWRRWL